MAARNQQSPAGKHMAHVTGGACTSREERDPIPLVCSTSLKNKVQVVLTVLLSDLTLQRCQSGKESGSNVINRVTYIP